MLILVTWMKFFLSNSSLLCVPFHLYSPTQFYFRVDLKLPGRTQMRLTSSQPRRPTSNVPKWSSLSMRSASPGTLTPQKRKRRKMRRKKTRWVEENVEVQGGKERKYRAGIQLHIGELLSIWIILAATLAGILAKCLMVGVKLPM